MDKKLKLLVIDVDGTLTDAGIYYDERGNELKKFCARDAAGFFAAQATGIKIMVLTGRECTATTRRMNEMKVDYLFQNIKDKFSFLSQFVIANNIKQEELGYIGDDLNDISSMQLAGFIGCPADSCIEVKNIASYVSTVNGGQGAVRDIIEYILRFYNEWDKAISNIYGLGV